MENISENTTMKRVKEYGNLMAKHIGKNGLFAYMQQKMLQFGLFLIIHIYAIIMSLTNQIPLIQMLEKYLLAQKIDMTCTLVKKEVDGVCIYNIENRNNQSGYASGFYENFLNQFIKDFNQYDNDNIELNHKSDNNYYHLDNLKLIGYVVQWTPSLEEFKKYYHLAINRHSVTVTHFIKKYEEAIRFLQKKLKASDIKSSQKLEKYKTCLHYLIAQGMNYNLIDKNNNNPESHYYILPPVATLHAMRPLALNYEQFKALTFEHFNNSLNVDCIPEAQRLSLANQMMKNEEDRKALAQCLGVHIKETHQSMVESDKPVSAIYLNNLANMHKYEFAHVCDFQKYMQTILALLKPYRLELGLEEISYVQDEQNTIIFAQSQNQNLAKTAFLKKVVSDTLFLFRNRKEALVQMDEMFDDDEIDEKKLGFKISNLILKCKLDMTTEKNQSDSNNVDNPDEDEIIKL